MSHYDGSIDISNSIVNDVLINNWVSGEKHNTPPTKGVYFSGKYVVELDVFSINDTEND